MGDQPTSYFYKTAKTRHGDNEIRAIKNENGDWISSSNDIKVEFIKYFDNLFKGEQAHIETVVGDESIKWFEHMPSLLESQIDHLQKPFNSDDVWEDINSMKPLKSPGSYGIPRVFIKKNWSTCGEETTKAILKFLQGGHMLKETNHTHIALIPKVDRPDSVNNSIL